MFINTNFLKLNDYGLSMIGLCFGIASSVVYGLSQVSRDFYVGGILDSGIGVFTVALRASLMKLVDADEAAKSNSIIAALEGTYFLIFSTVYNLIYNHTMDFMASAFYFANTFCYTLALGLTCALYLLFKSAARKKDVQSSQATLESTVDEKCNAEKEQSSL